ncbi:uncharacterized protein VTP21DRAFT_5038 [Calcarisporiella thermophila]|uniref:uncharacterized protein n=1 Tax=Calcarisporiella thermophila TaxID=911321 RepID=UPI003744050A
MMSAFRLFSSARWAFILLVLFTSIQSISIEKRVFNGVRNFAERALNELIRYNPDPDAPLPPVYTLAQFLTSKSPTKKLNETSVHNSSSTSLREALNRMVKIPLDQDYYPIKDEEVDAFRSIAKLCAIGYCRNFSTTAFECGERCKEFPNMTLAGHFLTPRYDINGYVAYDKEAQVIVVAWGGSVSEQNWIENAKIMPIKYSEASYGAFVHMGFQEAYEEARGPMLRLILPVLKEYPYFRLLITGHSLGGALATLNAADLYRTFSEFHNSPYGLQLVTFEQPRIGNKVFSDYIKQLPIYAKRVVYKLDPVPHVPISPLLWHPSGSEVWALNQNGDMVQCLNDNSIQCSRGISRYNVDDHMNFLDLQFGRKGCAGYVEKEG